jgi:hypothetical protein
MSMDDKPLSDYDQAIADAESDALDAEYTQRVSQGCCMTDMDNDMPGVLGIISGITQGIVTEAQLALRPDQTTTAEYYQDVLKRILAEAERAERVWSSWINRELPEHKEINE